MLTMVADGVLLHRSGWMESNGVVVRARAGVLVVDPGISEPELIDLANDLAELEQTVAAGFSTHPHWDHLLWNAALGTPPRYGTDRCATAARAAVERGIDAKRFGIPDDVSLELLGQLTGVPEGTTKLPWDGPTIRVLEHQAHAAGHAALLIEDARVLVAGDMLSDVFIPMLGMMGAEDPIGDYLTALDLLDGIAGEADLVIPGHGSVGDADELRRRLQQDRAYVVALRDGAQPDDPRIDGRAKPGWEFVADVHERQVAFLAQSTG